MSVKTYDPKNVLVLIGGVQISGFAQGSFVTIEREEDAYKKKVGSDGEVGRARSHNKSGSLTLTLMQTSNSNAVLTGFAVADETTGAGVVPIIVKEGANLAFSGEGWVRKIADQEYSDEVSDREWAIDLAILNMVSVGN